jgi:hypothetical protein
MGKSVRRCRNDPPGMLSSAEKRRIPQEVKTDEHIAYVDAKLYLVLAVSQSAYFTAEIKMKKLTNYPFIETIF